MTAPSAYSYYQALAALQPGDAVPAWLYIADYATGRRPRWICTAREELGAAGVQLELTDLGNGDMFDRCAVVVLTFPAKTLRTPVQPAGVVSGPAVLASSAMDLIQQARAAYKESIRL